MGFDADLSVCVAPCLRLSHGTQASQPPPIVNSNKTHISGLLVLAATAWLTGSAHAQDTQNNFGVEVINVATLSYNAGDDVATVETAPAIFTIRPPQTPATIEFFRHAPTATDPLVRAVNGLSLIHI